MSWKTKAVKYAKEQAPKEACGLLAIINGEETFWPCKNLAETTHEFFMLDPEDWAECEDTGEILDDEGNVEGHAEEEKMEERFKTKMVVRNRLCRKIYR